MFSVTENKDERKHFILTTSGNYFGVTLSEDAYDAFNKNSALDSFLDDCSCFTLSAVQDKSDGGNLHFSTKQLVPGNGKENILVFFKLRPEVITQENLHTNVFVSSMVESPIAALYHAIQKVYSPVLLKDDSWSSKFDPKLQDLIAQLETGLRNVIEKSDTLVRSGKRDFHGNTSVIMSPEEEVQFWSNVANATRHKDEREMGKLFYNALEPLAKEFSTLESLPLSDADRVLETADSVLDDLWKLDEYPYPQNRMEHLMDVIGTAVTRFTQKKLQFVNLWEESYSIVEEKLNDSIGICEKWVTSCERLTSLLWPNYAPHPWNGNPVSPSYTQSFASRLREVLQLRTIHRQLARLLTHSEQEELKMGSVFLPFTGLNPIQYNRYTDPLWRMAVKQFEHLLNPVEERAGSKLKTQLHHVNANTLQLMQEFKRYRDLIERPHVRKILVAERESLLAALSEYLQSLSSDFTAGRKSNVVQLIDMPEIISIIYWVRQLECKVADIEDTSSRLLADLNGYKELEIVAGDFLRELKEFHSDQFDSWTRDIGMTIHNKKLSLNTDEPVVYFEQGKLMHVNYNPRLVGLVREVRQLAVLGYKIPVKIQETTDLAKKFMRQAKALEQVANFHNTIGDRMIPSQRPMMLKAALELAQLVQEQNSVTWSDTVAVDQYIAKLQTLVERLGRENNKLTSYHSQIREKVILLMDTDLLRHQQQWKDILKDIRAIMSQVESQNFSNMKSWRAHWDHQLYKAVEHQYQLGLEALNQHLPEIKIELVYRQQELQFRPPMEEIRMKYYGQLKRFLSIPNNFRGISESPDLHIFPIIIERNAERFRHVFAKAEELFSRLKLVKAKWRDWVALGSVDLNQLAEENLLVAEDWERNFKASKTWSQEIAKLPSSDEKVECFSVSLLPVRAEIELHNRHYWDTLVSSLQSSIMRDVATVEKFTSEATLVLSQQPNSVEEIGKANVKHSEIMQTAPKMLQVLEEAQRKNKTLASWTKEHLEQVNRIVIVWDNFQTLLDNYQFLISRQVEGIKNSLTTQVENLSAEVEKFRLRWEQMKPRDVDLQNAGEHVLQRSLTVLRDKRHEWEKLLDTREILSNDCIHFDMDPPELVLFEEIENDLKKHEEMWSLFDEFSSGLQNFAKEEWIIFRNKTYKFEEFLSEWQEKLKSSKETTTLTVRVLQDVEKYKELLPLLKYVRGEMFSDKHWLEMFGLVGILSKPIENLVFGDFLSVKENILAQDSNLVDLNNRASSEIVIRQALGELDIWEVEAKFSLLEQKDSCGNSVMLITDFKDILNKVGDNQCLLQSIKNSPNYNSFIDRASIWETRLADLDEYLHSLNQIQRKWVYLEPIFGAGTLSQDQARFQRIDQDFRYIMGDVAKDQRVISLCRISNLHQILNTLLDQLSRCQKSLNDFLEEKRSAFPRFYFLGDEDLLEILGQSTRHNVIQAHLKKLFSGINAVSFDAEGNYITAIKSIDGETVPLKKQVKLVQQVEVWLSDLAREMKSTLQQLLLDCVREVEKTKCDPDPIKYPSQILCLTESVMFTKRCEEAITSSTLQAFLNTLKHQLEAYTNLELEWADSGESDSDLRDLELKLKALLLDTIHHIGVVEQLMLRQVTSVRSWQWQRQLRFYLIKAGVVVARMVDAEFEYTYEYQGNAPKLVHTPLTDKCYLTLTQGMHMGLGGNPYGPAGTGKTESVKALGGLLGRQVLVFNCDEGIDVKSMGRIFIGLVKCGAWGCFDEFNRLEETTLSAVSMQIQPIQIALKNRHKVVRLLDEEITIDPNSGIFVTLNPAGKAYGGRQKLPDNLKQLFRPVVMSQPDNELIAEVILYSEGFRHAKTIGRKIVELFELSRTLLSAQQHYDWGLRALKTVLKGCGTALKTKRKNLVKEGKTPLIDKESEVEVVVQALRLNTMSKLTFADCDHFDAVVKDMFPGTVFTSSGYEQLMNALMESYVEYGLSVNDNQLRKCMELYEQLQQRMGVVIVGPSGSGKSTICRVVKNALGRLGVTLKQHTINPKAMPRTQLLGHIDLDTRQWTDGVLTLSSQQVYSEPADVHSWIICDGDVDPEWIESLNSVLDDNRLLTLPSGWRIQFGPNVNFIFETHDLSYASPATVSRMGMIFLSNEDINVKGLVSSSLKTQSESTVRFLSQLIDDYFYKAVDWITQQGECVVGTSLVGTVQNGLSQLHGVFTRAHFTVAIINGLGGNLSTPSREEFAKQVFQWTGEFMPDGLQLQHLFYNAPRDCVDTYVMDRTDVETAMPTIAAKLPLILTPDMKKTVSVITTWLQSETRQPFLVVGPQGSGKSLILNHCFTKLRATEVAVIHCSAQITPLQVLQKLNQVCMVISSNMGRVYRPKNCDHLILYFKDINLARPDKWGTCMLVSFLQQLITYQGFYDNNLEWVGLENVQIVGSMTADGAVGHTLSTRFTSIVRIYVISYPEKEQLKSIYNIYLTHVMSKCLPSHPVWKSAAKITSLTSSVITVYEEVKSAFTAVQQNHYLFTPRDLTRWCLGLYRYDFNDEDKSIDGALEAVIYEGNRLFRDKLVSVSEQSKFDDIINSVFKTHWNIDAASNRASAMFFVTAGVETTAVTSALPTFGKPLGKMTESDWAATISQNIVKYGREGQALDVLLFGEMLDLVARVDRVLSSPCGSLLLAGRAATGRKSAVKIVSALHGATFLTLKMNYGYKLKHFKTDLKNMMQLAAVEGEQVFFVLEDHQLVDVTILDMINSLLLSGEVPGLFHQDELESVISPLKDMAAQDGFVGSPVMFFAERVRKNLHVVLLLDITNPHFAVMCDSNPAFYKQCSVLWLPGWKASTLQCVPHMIIDRFNSDGPETAHKKVEVNDAIVDGFVKIHSQASEALSNPRKYVSFIRTYIHIYGTKIMGIEERQKQLQAGVSKLTEARHIVDTLKVDANEQEKKLAEKQTKANSALQMITETMRSANTHKVEMESLKEQTERENQQLILRKKAIDEELAEIEPLIQQTCAAIGNIKSEALSEIRSLRAPPDIIRDILEGVLRLMGILDTSWNSMKTFLAKRGVKEDIRSFDARRITRESRQAVEKLLQDKRESFDSKNARRASAAAAPLASWVVANVKYSHVLEKIQPLEDEQSKLHENLKVAKDQIGRLSSGLEDVDQTVAELKQQLSTFTKEAAEIEIHLGKAQETLVAAESLVGKLNNEYERWQKQLGELSEDQVQLPGYSLLAAACVTYLSASSEDVRTTMLSSWERELGITKFSLTSFLGTEKETLQWSSEGLPSGQLSVQNAVIILQIAFLEPGTSLRPFLIDPSTLAMEWLKKHLRDKTVEVTSQNNNRFATTLELAIRFGKVLIIQDVDSIEPILFPVLRGEFINQGPRKVVQLGDKLIDYNDNFQLFLTSCNVNPEISPSSSAIITFVNFTMTQATLADQLLASVLRLERPELEQRRADLLRKEEELKLKVDQLQEVLLHELANAQGDILQNKELLSSLNEAKANSCAVYSSLSESNHLQKELEKECDVYRPLVESGSKLYFAINELQKINTMYQFSAISFTRLFQDALKPPEGGSKSDLQMKDYQRRLEHLVYYHVTRALFKADHVLLALHLLRYMHQSYVPDDEWKVFIGLAMADIKLDVTKVKGSVPDWIEEDRKFDIFVLKSALPALYSQLLLEDRSTWLAFSTSSDCENNLPVQLARKLSPFQQVLLVQALRPDRLLSALTQMATQLLALQDLSPPALSLKHLISKTLPSEPILLLVSPGADPSEELRRIAHHNVGSDRYHEVAMGQGLADSALELLRAAAQSGDWLCLKNLHLMMSWLPVLEMELRALQPHDNFRLWLTTEAHPKFPAMLAQSCLKITYEAPRGVKKNLLQIYTLWGPELRFLSVLHGKSLFVLAWFHAVVLERRTYIPQGWAKFYEFSDADLRAAREVMQQLFGKDNAFVDWEFIHGLYENAIYGGHVDNMSDIHVVSSYLQEFFNTRVINEGSTPLGPGISIPSSTNFKDYLEVIQKLSDSDKPQYFGLPENVEQSLERVTSRRVINQLKSLKRPVEGKTKFDRNEWQKQLAPVLNLWKKLNQGMGFIKMKITASETTQERTGSQVKPITTFIDMEYQNGVLLVQHIHKSLAGISKVIRGTTVPSVDLSELAERIMKHQTPGQWQRLWEGPLEPLLYLRSVMTRAVAVQRWSQRSAQGNLLREPLDLSDLFHPGTFLCALKQQTARNLGVALDEVILVSSWTKNGLPSAHLSVTLSDLQLEGASFDGLRLTPNAASSPCVCVAPVCTIAWMPEGSAPFYSPGDMLHVPLYQTVSREHVVITLDVPCSGSQNKWIQAGAAFFLRS